MAQATPSDMAKNHEMARHTTNINAIELFNGDAFPHTGLNVTDSQIANHCSLNKQSANGGTGNYSDVEKKAAKMALLACREMIREKAYPKLRSLITQILRGRGVTCDGGFDGVVKLFHSDNSSYKLAQHVFYSCFTYPEEFKTTMFESIATSIITELGITFTNKTKGKTCVIETVKEALHTVRKPFMLSGKPKKSEIYLSTRQISNSWNGDLINVPKHEFANQKLGGWSFLITIDDEAKKIYNSNIKETSSQPDMSLEVKTKPVEAAEKGPYVTGSMVPGSVPKKPDSESSATVTLAESHASCHYDNLEQAYEPYPLQQPGPEAEFNVPPPRPHYLHQPSDGIPGGNFSGDTSFRTPILNEYNHPYDPVEQSGPRPESISGNTRLPPIQQYHLMQQRGDGIPGESVACDNRLPPIQQHHLTQTPGGVIQVPMNNGGVQPMSELTTSSVNKTLVHMRG